MIKKSCIMNHIKTYYIIIGIKMETSCYNFLKQVNTITNISK